MSAPAIIYGAANCAPYSGILTGAQNLGQLVTRAAAKWPNKVAWRFDAIDQTYTFSDIARATGTLARVLRHHGVVAGSKVAVHSGNLPEFPVTWLALARVGAVMVPINTAYRLADAGHVIRHSGAELIVTTRSSLGLATELAQASHGQLRVLELDLDHLDRLAPGADTDTGEDLVLDDSDSDTITNIQYTSGTTGLPKGCLLSNEYWLNLAASLVADTPRLNHSDVLLTAQPFHYIDPQWNVAAAMLVGAELVILDRFHPSTFWDRVRECRVTYFYCLGLMPTLLLKMPPSELDRQHSVRAISASAIPAHLQRDLESRWGVPWYESFGMTETGADLFIDEDDHDELLGTGSMGGPRRHRQAAVVNETGESVSPGITGQLLLRGPGLFTGYFRDQEASDHAAKDGWFATGDLVRADKSGHLYYMGRTKDMIRRSGENISAVEVEGVLQQHAKIRLAAVISVPDTLRGEEVLAFLVPSTPGEDVAELISSVNKFCREQLAYFKVPRYWRVSAELPMTPSERIAKQELLTGDPLQGAWDNSAGTWFGAIEGLT